MDFLVCLCVLAVVLGFVKTEDQPKEFVLGGTLTLRPEDWSTPITSITWKHQGNLLVEQSGTSEPEYYGQFKGRASLDFKTGQLKMSKLTKGDAGNYNVEINNKILPVGYQVNIITAVPVPSVVLKPLVCSKNAEDCSLHCEGNVDGAGTVQYFWKEDQDWKESTMKKEIKNDENTQKIKEFMCKVKNSVSEEESAAFPNPFYKEASSSAGLVVGIVMAVILLFVVAAVAGFLFYKKMFCFKNYRKETKTPKSAEANNANETERLTQPNSSAAGADPGSAPEPNTTTTNGTTDEIVELEEKGVQPVSGGCRPGSAPEPDASDSAQTLSPSQLLTQTV